jgi:ribosomal protein L10
LAITRERKEELVAIYGGLLKDATGFVVTEYRGLNVAQVNIICDKLREVKSTWAGISWCGCRSTPGCGAQPRPTAR